MRQDDAATRSTVPDSPDPGPERAEETFEVTGRGRGTALYLAMCLFLFVASLWLAAGPGGPGFVDLVGALMFGTAAGWFGVRLVRSDPVLELGPDGIVHHPGGVGGREIVVPWDEITGVRPGRWGTVEVTLRDPEFVLEQAGPIEGWQMKRTMASGRSPLVLDPSTLSASAAELERRIGEEIDRRLLEEVRERPALEGDADDEGYSSSQA